MNIVYLSIFRVILGSAMLLITHDVGVLDVDPLLSGAVGIVIGIAVVWLTCDLIEQEYH